jgi:hypothetical protein
MFRDNYLCRPADVVDAEQAIFRASATTAMPLPRRSATFVVHSSIGCRPRLRIAAQAACTSVQRTRVEPAFVIELFCLCS